MRGALKNAPVIGLPILSGLKKDGAEYTGGKILDPQWQGLQRQNPDDRCWQETQRSRLRRRISAGSFADLASPGVERQSSAAQTAVFVLRLRDGILSSADRSNVSEDI